MTCNENTCFLPILLINFTFLYSNLIIFCKQYICTLYYTRIYCILHTVTKISCILPTLCVVVVSEGVLYDLSLGEGGPDHAHQPALLQDLLGVHPPLVGRTQEAGLVTALRELK